MEPVAVISKIDTLPSLPNHLDIKPSLRLLTDHTGIGAYAKVLPIERESSKAALKQVRG